MGEALPILKAGQLDIISHSAEQSGRLGMRLGALLRAGDVICLSGNMGAGKTIFAAGIGRGWGAKHPLTSPTFNLVHDHTRVTDKQHLYHLDCYRFEKVDDAEAIGFDDILAGSGAVIIEWPEQIAPLIPIERLWIEIRVLDATRRSFSLDAVGKRSEDLLIQFRESTFGA